MTGMGAINRNGRPSWEDGNKKDRYVIESRQLAEIECCLGDIEINYVDLHPWHQNTPDFGSLDHVLNQMIYMFYRKHSVPVRIYLGQSFFGRERIEAQIKICKWATHAICLSFMGYLYPQTLRLIETCLLRRCPKIYIGALWHNEMSIKIRSKDPLMQMAPYPVLDELVSEIIEIFGEVLPRAAFVPYRKNTATHSIGDPRGDFYGLLSQRGRLAMLLKGSRVSSRAPNIKALRKVGGSGYYYGSSLYYQGKMEHKPQTKNRPAGFVVTEDFKFQNREEAAKFLTLDRLCPSTPWKKITPDLPL